jgi:hypothetical protein
MVCRLKRETGKTECPTAFAPGRMAVGEAGDTARTVDFRQPGTGILPKRAVRTDPASNRPVLTIKPHALLFALRRKSTKFGAKYNRMKKITGAISVLLLTGFAVFQFCVKPPDYPDEPVIDFKTLSKNTMYQATFGQDSVVITFSFTDGDGDLGFQDDQSSIFIVDGRDSFSKPPYRIPYIEQQGAGNAFPAKYPS